MLPMLGNGMVSVAENLGAPSGVAALLIAVAPLMIVVFRFAEGDRPRPLTVLGVLLGFAGLGVLVLVGGGAVGGFPVGPALLVMFASTCWALGSYVQPRLWLPRDVFVTTVYEMLFGGLSCSPSAGSRASRSPPRRTARAPGRALGYLVVFGSVVAFTSYVWLLANAPISFVATYAYVNPVVAVFLGWLVLDEHVTLGGRRRAAGSSSRGGAGDPGRAAPAPSGGADGRSRRGGRRARTRRRGLRGRRAR